MPDYIKILLCGAHRLVREGLRKILEAERDIKIVGEANNEIEALNVLKKANPDIILMDISMPELDGIDTTYKIKKISSNVNIIIITVYEDDLHIFDAIKAGAMGYLLKDASSGELIASTPHPKQPTGSSLIKHI